MNLSLRRMVVSSALFAVLASSALAQDVWTGGGASANPAWTNPANWQSGTNPAPSDSLTFAGSTVANNNDYPAGTAFDSITFAGGASTFTLAGNSILLSGATNGTNVAIANDSGILQMVSLNLALDWGYYIFSGNNSPGLSLSGTLTLNQGSLAYFDSFVSASALTVDGTGLIAGLDGAGLIESAGAPTGLATVSGGVIVPYAAYTTLTPGGTIPSAAVDNIEMNSGGANGTSTYTANGATINTITSLQAGNTQGTNVDLVTNIGVLTFGNNGGIYVLDSGAGTKTDFVLSGGSLTAGTNGAPATFIMAVNGTTPANQMEMNSVIQDNGTGGPVTVVSTGNGSRYFNKANTYSGGTYVNQGQLQASTSVNDFGTGPVYIAGGATVYLATGGNYTNNLYLAPGLGDTTGSGAIANPGSVAWAANGTLSGKITLQGAPALTGHGDRIAGNNTGGAFTISGQITGSGTLEIGGAHTSSYVLANTNTANVNNWQGGIIFNSAASVNLSLKMGANNQLPSGPNAGNVTMIPAGGTAFYASLNLNGYNATINGLVSSGSSAQPMIADGDSLGLNGGGNSTLTFGANDTTASFGGVSTNRGVGVLSLVKIGAGTQTFTGVLSHSGSTTVSNGTFLLTGSIPNSSNIMVGAGAIFDASQNGTGGLQVGANQTLSGNGSVLGSTSVFGAIAGVMAVNGGSTNIGTLTNNGNLTLNGGATNIFYMINASGGAGTATGTSLISLTNSSQLILANANASTPIHVKVVSLLPGGSPGNATFNPNANQSWILVQSTAPISGYTSPQQFLVDTTGFGNLPNGVSQFSVAPDQSGDNLVLSFTSTPVITTGLISQTNNAGTTATFSVSAAGPTPISYQWFEGSSPLVNGGTSLSGGAVTITTNGAGTTSTLTIAGVEDADAGAILVNVTNSAAGSGSSSATLTIIDPPSNPNVAQLPSTAPVAAGEVTQFTASANGTGPFTYAWSFNGTPLTNGTEISGANSMTLAVNTTPSAAGTYTVVISNPAGSVMSGDYVINPVTSVPNQVIYEPFSEYAEMSGPVAPYTFLGVTNLYNEQTGEPAYWYHYSGARTDMNITANEFSYFSPGYPWAGLAGDSINSMNFAVTSVETDNDHLQFSKSGYNPGQSVYFSFLLECDNLGSANVSDCIAAFCSSDDGTSFNLKLSTQVQANNTYWLGLSKGSGVTGNQGVDASTIWVTNFVPYQDILVVGCYQINSGVTSNDDDTVSMWFDPTNTSFGTTNIPVPDLGPSDFGVANSAIHTFAVHGTQFPGNRNFSDLRIGTTWASVTPPSAPSLTVNDESVTNGGTAVFTSVNAGNPVTTYSWYFDGTNGAPLANGVNGDGSVISGANTGTLTISNVTAAELGTYTVVGMNNDPLSNAILTGSASGVLSFVPATPPTLEVARQAGSVVISWPAIYASYMLEETGSLAPPIGWSIIPTNSYVLSGTNETYTVSPLSTNAFYQLIGP